MSGSVYRLLLLLHIACAILGFGGVAFNGLYRARARQLGGAAEAAVVDVNGFVSRLSEYMIYAVFVLGLLVALTSDHVWELKQAWLSAAMFLNLVDIAVLHAVIHKGERDFGALLGTVNGAGQTGRSVEVTQLESLERRIRLGWAGFDLIFLVILYLMVFTPGQLRIG